MHINCTGKSDCKCYSCKVDKDTSLLLQYDSTEINKILLNSKKSKNKMGNEY